MSGVYNNVLKRLTEERHRLALSQREMGRYVRMNQSSYSKVELGNRRLNYYELKRLCESDVDMFYVFTGKRCDSKYIKLLEMYSYEELSCILNMVLALTELRRIGTEKDIWKNLLPGVECLEMWDLGRKSGRSLFYYVRQLYGISQKEMSEVLGMDVKKFRDLENGRCLPDSELLCRMYELFDVSPAIFLRDRRGLAEEICCLLEIAGREEEEMLWDLCRLWKAESPVFLDEGREEAE